MKGILTTKPTILTVCIAIAVSGLSMSANAQFPIKIPAIPKIKKEKPSPQQLFSLFDLPHSIIRLGE